MEPEKAAEGAAADKALLLGVINPPPSSWTPSAQLKDFKGVTLDNNWRVTEVRLQSCGLTGTLDLSNLPQGLQVLNLANNQLTLISPISLRHCRRCTSTTINLREALISPSSLMDCRCCPSSTINLRGVPISPSSLVEGAIPQRQSLYGEP